MSTRCKCGRGKIDDASMCDTCWDKQRPYDERCAGDPNYCSCGSPKISDASLCDACWNRQAAAYGD